MPTPGKRWHHVTISTHNAWLPGDPRGWRARHHKRHSSGDHRHPPPRGEHAGLHRYARTISGEPVRIPAPMRKVLGAKFLDHLAKLGHSTLVLSVSAMHVHALVELPLDRCAAKHEIGRCKQAASLLLKDRGGQKLWQRSCGLKPIRDRAHQRNTFGYIRDHEAQGAWGVAV